MGTALKWLPGEDRASHRMAASADLQSNSKDPCPVAADAAKQNLEVSVQSISSQVANQKPSRAEAPTTFLKKKKNSWWPPDKVLVGTMAPTATKLGFSDAVKLNSHQDFIQVTTWLQWATICP